MLFLNNWKFFKITQMFKKWNKKNLKKWTLVLQKKKMIKRNGWKEFERNMLSKNWKSKTYDVVWSQFD